jgi:hypothetical protein
LSLSEGKIFEEFLVIVYITVKAKSTVFMVFLLHSPANKVKDVFTILSVSGVCDLTLFRIYENDDFFFRGLTSFRFFSFEVYRRAGGNSKPITTLGINKSMTSTSF